MGRGSLWKAMKSTNKQAAGFCPWCNTFANQNKCFTLQHFKCEQDTMRRALMGSGLGACRACSLCLAATLLCFIFIFGLSDGY